MTTEATTYTIPEFNMERLEKEMARLNKRGAKLGCAPFAVVVVGEKFIPDPYEIRREMNDNGGRRLTQTQLDKLPRIKVVDIQLDGEGPKLEGYRFVGRLDHLTIPGKVIVATVPGEVVPPEFFEVAADCTHCNKIRRRKDTFVFLHEESGDHVQVGRNCLKDFFGHDPARIASLLASFFKLMDSFGSDDEWGFGSGRGMHCLPAKTVLANTVAIIRGFGWVPRSMVDAPTMPTADAVKYYMTHTPRGEREQREWDWFVSQFEHLDEDDVEVEGALAWLAEQDGSKSEYMHNLKVLQDVEFIPVNMLGYFCSIISAYQRANERLKKIELEKRDRKNEHVGNIKDRLELEVECTGLKYIASNFGTVCIHQMVDSEGRTLTWFANTDAKMKEGDKYKVKATVKKHDEFRDWKQTQVSRLTVQEQLAA